MGCWATIVRLLFCVNFKWLTDRTFWFNLEASQSEHWSWMGMPMPAYWKYKLTSFLQLFYVQLVKPYCVPHSIVSHHCIFLHRGVVLSPAVIPIGLTVTWKKLSKAGVLLGPLIGATLGESHPCSRLWNYVSNFIYLLRHVSVAYRLLEDIRFVHIQRLMIRSLLLTNLSLKHKALSISQILPNLIQPYAAVLQVSCFLA